MAVNFAQEVLSILDALPDAVLIVNKARGVIIGANDLFFARSGLKKEAVFDAAWNHLPFVNRHVKQGLLRLLKKIRNERRYEETFVFPYSASDGTTRNFSTTVRPFFLEEEECILFNFKEVSAPEILLTGENSEAWNTFLRLSLEPYLEFRPSECLSPPLELEDRIAYLKFAGDCLRVKLANEAAVKTYKGEKGVLTGEPFSSFFCREEDAFRFLDMLSIVGQVKAETTVNAYDRTLQVEMNCAVRFDEDGSIAAVYCGQRGLSANQRYQEPSGSNPVEMNFMFHQPFTGFAFLAPAAPIDRPQAENVDEQLDESLSQIRILNVNDAMIEIYETEKSKFLMKPMTSLFRIHSNARQVLKELFVMRTTSVKRFAFSNEGNEDVLERVSIYTATFDDSGRLNGVLVAVSKYHADFKARHVVGQAAERDGGEEVS